MKSKVIVICILLSNHKITGFGWLIWICLCTISQNRSSKIYLFSFQNIQICPAISWFNNGKNDNAFSKRAPYIFLPGGDIVVVVVVSVVDINSKILLNKQSLNSSTALDDVLQVWILLITLFAPTQKVPLVEPLFATYSKNCSWRQFFIFSKLLLEISSWFASSRQSKMCFVNSGTFVQNSWTSEIVKGYLTPNWLHLKIKSVV